LPYLTVNFAGSQADTPEELYKNDITIGKEGLRWEKTVNLRNQSLENLYKLVYNPGGVVHK
jgi:hypothetical protein